ncbi:MAG: ABC transporter ATP-binding protein [Pirellulales bacterium]
MPKCSIAAEPGEKIALLEDGQAGSTELFDILFGLKNPSSGHAEIEHMDPRDLRPDVLRHAVALVRGAEVFEGTIAENIQLGRADISMMDVRSSLYDVGLLEDVLRLPEGLDTRINGSGLPLSMTQRILLVLARAIAGRPRLLLIDGALDTLGDRQLSLVCESLQEGSRDWTLFVSTNRREVAERFDRVVDLARCEPALTDGAEGRAQL